ncbi:MAG: hypothetical protein E7376_04845 [Clostridiales bacterium]|nr:hypothetical protein [Clostridiales bacterium]
MKKLIKSYSFWTSLAGALGLLAVSIGKLCGIQITASGVEEIVMAVCGVLVVFGIVTKPKQQTEATNKEISGKDKTN